MGGDFAAGGNRPMVGMSLCDSVMMAGVIFSRAVAQITSP